MGQLGLELPSSALLNEYNSIVCLLVAMYSVQYCFYHSTLSAFFGGSVTGGLITFYKKSTFYPHDKSKVISRAFDVQGGDWMNYLRPRSFLAVQLRYRNSTGTTSDRDDITVVNTHPNALPSATSCHNRTQQMNQIITFCSMLKTKVVVCGDMNIDSQTAEIDALTNNGFVDAWSINTNDPGNTWCAKNPRCAGWLHSDDCRIDYIFQRGMEVLSSSVVLDELVPGVGTLSDHYGVMSNIAVYASTNVMGRPYKSLKEKQETSKSNSKKVNEIENLKAQIGNTFRHRIVLS